ncbi:Maltase-glucoamylase, intestinal [Armadillidium vulgare]|nr:Maltase-glucoamylase, intestinal [Armadillidium vulgare]
MKVLILFALIFGAFAEENIVDIICPIPGNPTPTTVTQEQCDQYTACEFSSEICHMKPNNESGYLAQNDPVVTSTGFTQTLEKADSLNTLFGDDIGLLTLEVLYHEDYHVQIKIYDSANSRYEVPLQRNLPSSPGSNPLYTVTTSGAGEPFKLQVARQSSGTVVFETIGPLTFEDQFIQLTTLLASEFFYGLGETSHETLRRQFNQRKTTAIFTRERLHRPGIEDNLYGAHPYYLNIEDQYSTFLTDESPALTIRTIGGIVDLHIFFGPSPEDVTSQYTNFVGRPFLPPYWALGFQLSRWGYGSLANYQEVYDRMRAAQIPWDTQYFDIDYMENYHDFTYDPVNFADLPTLASTFHQNEMTLVLIQDPAIAAEFYYYGSGRRGRESDVYVKWSSPFLVPIDQPDSADDYVVGNQFLQNNTVYPDFLKPATGDWWANELEFFHELVNFDGIWLDEDEPTNFATDTNTSFPNTGRAALQCPVNFLDDPPYATLAAFDDDNTVRRLSDNTLCMAAAHSDGTTTYYHYDVHSLYGHFEAKTTFEALANVVRPGIRPFVLMRSTFPGSGQYGAHWLGDNSATWEDLRLSLVGIIEFNLFGIPFAGADVCGFNGEPDEELCIRWMQAGAFYPLDRNHNTNGTADQDPARPGWDQVTEASKAALQIRYRYLPYFYSVLHNSHMYGRTAVRGLFSEFPTDLVARAIEDEFLWGSALLVAPVVQQGTTYKEVYFPDGIWYDLLEGFVEAYGPSLYSVYAPLSAIPLYVRGGYILPFHEPGITTTESRQNKFGLTVALDYNEHAEGELYWDDGLLQKDNMDNSYVGNFVYDQGELTLSIQYSAAAANQLVLNFINIYGYNDEPSEVYINGNLTESSNWVYNNQTGVLNFAASLPLNEEFVIDFV